MSVLYIAIPVALSIAGLALWAFARAVKQGQMDDLETPAMRILHDDDGYEPPE
ncbi:MAG: cbb3-type cytochrome oxidase assembly protein CcoS [Nannocystaceae bacterium]|nr:cbb3-type cytochrome oxidase assembly protein CcoS [bacterium]